MIFRKNREPKAPEWPRLVVELVDNAELNVAVTWPPGTNVDLFAQLLVFLCEGKMAPAIANSAALHATMIEDIEGGAAIYLAMKKVAAKAAAEEKGHEDDPVVCPTDMMRVNMKAFQG